MQIVNRIRTLKRRIFRSIDGPRALRAEYKRFHGIELPAVPKTFTQKLFARMIDVHSGANPEFTRLSDKYLARDFIRERIGENYLVDLLWHGDDPDAIPFDDFPDVCIAKANHGSAMTMVLRKPADQDRAVALFRKWLATNYYWETREFQYFAIKPRLLVERFLDDGHKDGPLDYRFWCFHGTPEVIQVDNNDHSINPFYTMDWSPLELSYRPSFKARIVDRPENFNEMISVAKKLSHGFDFVRVDLYNVRGKIYAGELTFTPAIGQLDFKPKSWDLELGKKW